MAHTIAAYSGGGLPAAIGLIRMSGETAHEIFETVFKRKSTMPLHHCIPGKLYMGTLLSAEGREIDFCMGSVYHAPKSYTGENLCELYCHGSGAIVSAALEHCYALGALPAQPGEFTRRAFLNGKMDLVEAEAVADLIDSTSSLSAAAAVRHLKGAVTSKLAPIREEIGALLAHFYAVCDYPDEDLDPFHLDKAARILEQSAIHLENLAKSYEQGKIVRHGLPVALLGKPNVGKSTLFNALAGHSRAIVTDEAGTTRDVIDQVISARGNPIRLFDTAGIRTPQGKAEEMGIEKTCETAAQAAAALWVIDGDPTAEDEQAAHLALQLPRRALVVNKTDKNPIPSLPPSLSEQFPHVFYLSAEEKIGLAPLIDWLANLSPSPTQDVMITSARQAALLTLAARDLTQAAHSCINGATADAFLSDAERALNTLGQLTGQTTNADIAAEIFSRFCVGK